MADGAHLLGSRALEQIGVLLQTDAPMFAAAGIVVTEISTRISAPDLVEVSDSTPAVPAKRGR